MHIWTRFRSLYIAPLYILFVIYALEGLHKWCFNINNRSNYYFCDPSSQQYSASGIITLLTLMQNSQKASAAIRSAEMVYHLLKLQLILELLLFQACSKVVGSNISSRSRDTLKPIFLKRFSVEMLKTDVKSCIRSDFSL